MDSEMTAVATEIVPSRHVASRRGFLGRASTGLKGAHSFPVARERQVQAAYENVEYQLKVRLGSSNEGEKNMVNYRAIFQELSFPSHSHSHRTTSILKCLASGLPSVRRQGQAYVVIAREIQDHITEKFMRGHVAEDERTAASQ